MRDDLVLLRSVHNPNFQEVGMIYLLHTPPGSVVCHQGLNLSPLDEFLKNNGYRRWGNMTGPLQHGVLTTGVFAIAPGVAEVQTMHGMKASKRAREPFHAPYVRWSRLVQSALLAYGGFQEPLQWPGIQPKEVLHANVEGKIDALTEILWLHEGIRLPDQIELEQPYGEKHTPKVSIDPADGYVNPSFSYGITRPWRWSFSHPDAHPIVKEGYVDNGLFDRWPAAGNYHERNYCITSLTGSGSTIRAEYVFCSESLGLLHIRTVQVEFSITVTQVIEDASELGFFSLNTVLRSTQTCSIRISDKQALLVPGKHLPKNEIATYYTPVFPTPWVNFSTVGGDLYCAGVSSPRDAGDVTVTLGDVKTFLGYIDNDHSWRDVGPGSLLHFQKSMISHYPDFMGGRGYATADLVSGVTELMTTNMIELILESNGWLSFLDLQSTIKAWPKDHRYIKTLHRFFWVLSAGVLTTQFALIPTYESMKEIQALKLATIASKFAALVKPRKVVGTHTIKNVTIGEYKNCKITYRVHCYIALDVSPYVMYVVGLDMLGLLPNLERLWAISPLSWLVDAVSNSSDVVKAVSSFSRIAMYHTSKVLVSTEVEWPWQDDGEVFNVPQGGSQEHPPMYKWYRRNIVDTLPIIGPARLLPPFFLRSPQFWTTIAAFAVQLTSAK